MKSVLRWTLVLFILLFCLGGCAPSAKKKNEAKVHYTLGVSYLREPNPTAALKEFLKAQEIDDDDPEVQNGLGQAYFMKKAYNEAEKHFLLALKIDPQNPQYQNNLAALYLDMNRFDDAIIYFSNAAENLLFQRSEIALTGVGIAQNKKANYLEAVASFKKAIEVNPRYFLAHFHLGEAYYALNNMQLAIAEFREALRIVPGNPRGQYQLALALVKARQMEEASGLFLDIVKRFPDSELGRLSGDYLKIIE